MNSKEPVYTNRFVAYGTHGQPITSVYATSEEDATRQVEEELQKNPSRLPYYRDWVEAGRPVRPMDGWKQREA